MKKKSVPAWDVLKFILSIMVVMIHTSFFREYSYPWLRIAVPMFFMISSYFFFLKRIELTDYNDKKEHYKNFILRNLKLYLFWFVVTLPVTLYIRHYFVNGFIMGIIEMLRSFLFSSTFVASWYIMALIIGISIIIRLEKVFKLRTLMGITFLIYVIVVLRSSYGFIFKNIKFISNIVGIYEKIFSCPETSFPAGLFWINCGKIFAEKKHIEIQKFGIYGGLIASCILLYIEWYYVKLYSGSFSNNCYLFLIPVCLCLFFIVSNIKVTTKKDTRPLRKMSTIIYAIHGSLTPVVFKIFEFININNNTMVFFTVVFICLFVSIIIFWLEKNKMFKILKYAY